MIENRSSRRPPINPSSRPPQLLEHARGYTTLIGPPLDLPDKTPGKGTSHGIIAHGSVKNTQGQSEQDIAEHYLLSLPRDLKTGMITHYNRDGKQGLYDDQGKVVFKSNNATEADALKDYLLAHGFTED